MVVVGLTGGIGSGKSTVSEILEARGAVVIDADRIARQVVEPGGPAYGPVVERFGRRVVGQDGSIDRPALASIVFADDDARADLERLTHPAIGAVIADRLAAERGTDHLVVLDVPLLVEARRNRAEVAAVIVVDTPAELAVERLVSGRGMDRADVEARMAAQADREKRLARADFVIDNSGSMDDLGRQVDRAVEWMEGLRETGDR